MAVQAFGWSDFAIGQLGLRQVDRAASCRAFRMDDRRQRIIVGFPNR
jgi:hypothetical protein